MSRKYYEAYDDRYRQVHSEDLKWFDETPSEIVLEMIRENGITKENRILEIGCGEGRDARHLLREGYSLLATDVSEEAVRYCRQLDPLNGEHYMVLDCVTERLEEKFDFIYAVAVLHMLVLDSDRRGFYAFIKDQLAENGRALICTMGDGERESSSDPETAFDLQERIHEPTGKCLHIAGTSYRGVSFPGFEKEIADSGLKLLRKGFTDIHPDYWKMMYALVQKNS